MLLSLSSFLCIFHCLSVCLYVCLSVSMSVCLCVFISFLFSFFLLAHLSIISLFISLELSTHFSSPSLSDLSFSFLTTPSYSLLQLARGFVACPMPKKALTTHTKTQKKLFWNPASYTLNQIHIHPQFLYPAASLAVNVPWLHFFQNLFFQFNFGNI